MGKTLVAARHRQTLVSHQQLAVSFQPSLKHSANQPVWFLLLVLVICYLLR